MSRRLLITDDAMVIRTMIKDAAQRAGWEVVAEAKNGQEAVDYYREFQPDAVTLDLIMPEFDGIHGLREMRQHDPEARIIVVSALNQKALLKQAFALGAADFVCKPFDADDLIKVLDHLVPLAQTV